MGKQARTPQAREQRSRTILAAALDQFSQQGFAAARLDDIAAAAGIAKGTLYLYFDSKEQLLQSLVTDTIGATLGNIEGALAASGATAGEKLRQLGLFFAQAAADPERRRVMHLVFSEGARFPDLARFYHREVISRGMAMVRAIIDQGLASGEFHHDEPKRFPQLVIAPALVASVWLHVFNPVLSDPAQKLDAPGLIEAHFDMLLRALTGEAS